MPTNDSTPQERAVDSFSRNPLGVRISARLSQKVGSAGPRFDARKLERIRRSLEQRGVSFFIGELAEELLAGLDSEALYFARVGRPGTIVLGSEPSRSAVIEELLHLGQHRRMGWGDISGQVPEMEVEAQKKLLRIAEMNNWWPEEMADLSAALCIWEEERCAQQSSK